MPKRLLTLLLFIPVGILCVASTFFLPVEFSGINGTSAGIWLFISNSGGVVGVPIICGLLSILIVMQFKTWKYRILAFLISFVFFASVLGGYAKFNENILKEQFKVERPYSQFIQTRFSFPIDDFYSLATKEKRAVFLDGFFGSIQKDLSKQVDVKISNHWISETGYSFPSGHTVNAFFLTTLFSYIFLLIFKGKRIYILLVGLMLWAIAVAFSRVAVGAHSAFDVTIGAGIGFLLGIFIILTTIIDRLLKHITI